jgi:hypothetical protein
MVFTRVKTTGPTSSQIRCKFSPNVDPHIISFNSFISYSYVLPLSQNKFHFRSGYSQIVSNLTKLL